jgi:hexulose-6-phosphate isomerase
MDDHMSDATRDIGIMQGRLVPRYRGRYQAFPRGYWQAEFDIARELGLGAIEFILDFEAAEDNPLLTESGRRAIADAVARTGVQVRSVCADYFMAAPFHSDHQAESERTLRRLIAAAAELGVRDVVIPCVDQSSLKSDVDKQRLCRSLATVLGDAEAANVNLALETDLPPGPFAELLHAIGSPRVTVNYDIGNSASLGFDPAEELEAYGTRITDLHVKDRVLGGSSVKLGTGNAQLDRVFALLAQLGYRGTIIMQASRAEPYLDDLARVAEQLEITRAHVRRHLAGVAP